MLFENLITITSLRVLRKEFNTLLRAKFRVGCYKEI